MVLPESLTTTTAFSKLLSALLFVLLPFVGFWLGMGYQRSLNQTVERGESTTAAVTPPTTKIKHISFDNQVRPILKNFAEKEWPLPTFQETSNRIASLLLKILESSDPTLEEQIDQEYRKLKSKKLFADSTDANSRYEALIKLCIAKALVNDDLVNIFSYCELNDPNPDYIFALPEWVNDTTAIADILPYFLKGAEFYNEGKIEESKYYFKQIKDHEKKLKEQGYFVEYRQILNVIDSLDTELYSEEEIRQTSFTANCDLEIVTNKQRYTVITGVTSRKSPTCSGSTTSRSKRYVAVAGIYNDADTIVKVYSIRHKADIILEGYFTYQIYNMLFLPQEQLAVLYGSSKEQKLKIYNVDGLFKTYPKNVNQQNNSFKLIQEHMFMRILPDGFDYTSLEFEYGKIKVVDLNRRNIQTIVITDLNI